VEAADMHPAAFRWDYTIQYFNLLLIILIILIIIVVVVVVVVVVVQM